MFLFQYVDITTILGKKFIFELRRFVRMDKKLKVKEDVNAKGSIHFLNIFQNYSIQFFIEKGQKGKVQESVAF